MKKLQFLPFVIIFFVVSFFFNPLILQNKLPIPSDTIIGLYHPFRDLYSVNYPNGIPYKNFLITDPVRQQYPWRMLAVNNLKKLQLPLWNSYNSAGTPLLANFQSAVFYPFNILFIIFPFSIGWSLLIFLQPLLAGAFIYLYLDNLKLDRRSSMFGALIFAFCGFMTAWLEWGTIGHTALWLPIILLSVDKLIIQFESLNKSNIKNQISNKQLKNKRLAFWSLAFIFSLTSAFFAGHLQTFFYLMIVSIAYFLMRWWQNGKSKRTLIIFLLLFFCFLFLTVVQWLPTLNFINLSARGVDLSWQKAGWFIPWQHLVQFVAPDFFGNPTTLNYWGEWNYAEFIGYVGIFPFLMSLFGVMLRRDKTAFFFGTVFLLSLVFSLPTFFAKIPYIMQIPLLSTSQPTRLLFLTDFSLAILAALGLDAFTKQNKKIKSTFPIAAFVIIFSLLWYFVFSGYKFFPSVSYENVLVAKRNLYFPTLLLLISIILLLTHRRIKNIRYKNLLLLILMVITMFDLFRFFSKFTPFTDTKYLFPMTETISFLKKQKGEFRIMTADDRILPPNFSTIYKLHSIEGYDPLYLLSYGELMASVKRSKPDISSPFGFNRIIAVHNTDSRIIDLMGVKYVLSLDELESPKLKKVFSEGQTKVYENNQVFDRAFFVNNISPVSSKNEAIENMFDKKINLKETAVVQGWDSADTNFAIGTVNIVKYEDNYVELRVNNDNDGFLILMDTYYPSWNAAVCAQDGNGCKDTRIYQTNYNFRGIIVPKGDHKILFNIKLL